ncbi:hypothetical protein M0R45_006569 [Rubus argutus]|uniref:Uncharacterized protein n=1 Tax=Rubus argutus TaxID=59490 RepID=A0AAW1YRH5_RUBAR
MPSRSLSLLTSIPKNSPKQNPHAMAPQSTFTAQTNQSPTIQTSQSTHILELRPHLRREAQTSTMPVLPLSPPAIEPACAHVVASTVRPRARGCSPRGRVATASRAPPP